MTVCLPPLGVTWYFFIQAFGTDRFRWTAQAVVLVPVLLIALAFATVFVLLHLVPFERAPGPDPGDRRAGGYRDSAR